MLGLQLRPEFKAKILKGTAIDFNKEMQKSASEFLEITYPSNDLLKLLEAVGPKQNRPVVLIGERGQGKSHLMTALYHLLTNIKATNTWLNQWSDRLERQEIADLQVRSNIHVIAESLQRQNYKFLWDLILERHPNGEYIRGKWEGQGDKKTDILSYELLLELFKLQPTAIFLDEFQTWYDALTNTKQYPWKNWAFNFIQILSEIAKDYPELLVLVVSVRNGNSDAYQQIHRVGPVLIDFKGEYAKRDRKRLLLHRLFDNRTHISNAEILNLIKNHLIEYKRLLSVPELEHDNINKEFIEAWPFSPDLIQLLEDQVLIATEAQETRDLIIILANLFKQSTNNTVIITAANFLISKDHGGITALLDSVSNEYHRKLREKAIRNLDAVLGTVENPEHQLPNAENIISSLWLRSLAVDKFSGASRNMLHVDITQGRKIDDNSFSVELDTIVSNSFNIHQNGDRYLFKEAENPQAKLLAYARNDRAFVDGSDAEQLAKEIRYVIAGSDDVPKKYRVIVLKKNWRQTPWGDISETEHPSNFNGRIPIVVIPEMPEKINEVLGEWLGKHITSKRNTVRFLLPKPGTSNLYYKSDLIILARAILKAGEWVNNEPVYRQLLEKYRKDLRDQLKSLFDRFAVLSIWSFNDPKSCLFHVNAHQATNMPIPDAMDLIIKRDIFIPEDFNEIAEDMAENNETVAKLISELQEPRSDGQECVPWLGETEVKEKLIRLCAKGKIAINVRDIEYLVAKSSESEEEAWQRMKGKLGTGIHLAQTYILKPSAIPATASIIGTKTTQGDTSEQEQKQDQEREGKEQTNIFDGSDERNTSGNNPAGGLSGTIIFENPSNLKNYRTEPTSALNLMGKIEGWGINAGSSIKNVNIKIEHMSGAQLQKLLRILPDGVTYGIQLDKEDEH